MLKVLFIGQDPETVDFADPALPPGATAEKIKAGIDLVIRQMTERGWTAKFCSVQPDATAAAAAVKIDLAQGYDCVVIGGGIRLPPKSLAMFERSFF